jgi:DNA-binding NarL/FixJ family response regulator
MISNTIVVAGESKRINALVLEYLSRIGCADTIVTVPSLKGLITAVKKARPRLILCESNYCFELTAYRIAEIIETFPLVPIAVFSIERLTPGKAVSFINLGAESFIDLRLDDELEIHDAFHRVTHEKIYMPRWVSDAVGTKRLAVCGSATATNGELMTLRLFALGNNVSDIAYKMGISHATVRNYFSNLHKKFCVHSNNELIPLALRLGVAASAELAGDENILGGKEQ